MGIKLKIQIALLVSFLLAAWYITTHFTVVQVSQIQAYKELAKKDSVSIYVLSKETIKKDSIISSFMQSNDIDKSNIGKLQAQNLDLSKQLKKLYDNGGIIERYFVKPCFSSSYYEVKNKPSNIKYN